MANLGTQDRIQSLGLQGIANGIAQNAIRNGTWGDKLAALIGGYIGNRMGENKYKKDLQKLDAIKDQAKATDVLDTDSVISTQPMSQDEYSYIMNGNVPNNGVTGISTEPTVDPRLLQNSVGTQGPATKQIPFNPNYNMDYIEREARRQGVHSRAWDEQKDAIQRDVARNAEAFYLPQIQQKLYGTSEQPATTDSIIEGMGMLNELGRYSPDAAKAYQALAVGGLQGNQKFEQQKQLQQIKANNAVNRANQQLANRIAYREATAGLGNSSKGNNGGLKSSDYINLGKRHTELGEMLKEQYPDGKLPMNDPNVQQYLNIASMLGLGGNSQVPQQQQSQQQKQVPTQQAPAQQQPKAETKSTEPVSQADAHGFKNNWSDWDIQNKDLAAMRWEYVTDPEAFRQKYGFKTFSEYMDWLNEVGE